MARPSRKSLYLERLQKLKDAAAAAPPPPPPPKEQDPIAAALTLRLNKLNKEFLDPIRQSLGISKGQPWTPPSLSARANIFRAQAAVAAKLLTGRYWDAEELFGQLNLSIEKFRAAPPDQRTSLLTELEQQIKTLEFSLQELKLKNKKYIRWKKI